MAIAELAGAEIFQNRAATRLGSIRTCRQEASLIEVAGLDAEALLEADLAKYRGRIEAKGTLERGVPHSQRE